MSSVSPPAGCPAHTGGGPLAPGAPAARPAGATVHDTPTGLMSLPALVGSPDPRAGYRALRAEWGDVAGVEIAPGVPAWLVMGYRELLTVTRQEQLFSRDARAWHRLRDGAAAADLGLLPAMAGLPGATGSDGPEHRRLRQPLDDGVARIDQRRVRRDVEALCAGLIAGFSGRGSADLVTEYAAVVPVLSLASLLGLDAAGGRELRDAVAEEEAAGGRSRGGGRRVERILLDALRARRAEPANDLATVLLGHPDLHSEAERVQSLAVLVFAGNETVTAWIAHTLQLMLADPRFAARLHGGQLGVDDGLDEALWRDPPLHTMPARYALRDTELGGHPIRQGDCLVLGLAAANDDPDIRPEDGEVDWGNRAHLAFSAGPHTCPARVPARLITRTAVQMLLNLLPDLRLAVPVADLVRRPSPWTRIPVALPAAFTPARTADRAGV